MGETREEKMFRNWMNSLGVRPHVNHLYSDLYNGLIIFQLMDYIKPGIVDWEKRVIREEKMSKMLSKRFQEVLSNCNYAVELARKLNLVIVGIAGSDIQEGNPTLTLAVVWQLMRSYTLSLLSRLNTSSGDRGLGQCGEGRRSRLPAVYGQRQVRRDDGQEDWSSRLCPAGGYCLGEAQDDHDGL